MATHKSPKQSTYKSPKQSTTFCLNMIVKNEAHIIEETLESIRPYISYWVISDTGSTDGTQDKIKSFFEKAGIPGKLYQDEWKGFGYNRTKALEEARGICDYTWVIDADDVIAGNLVFPKKMGADFYKLQIRNESGGMLYDRYQIFRSKLEWEYVGVLHEYPECVSKPKPIADPVNNVIKGDYYLLSRRLGDRSKDELKYQKDAMILSKSLEEEIALFKQKKAQINKINQEFDEYKLQYESDKQRIERMPLSKRKGEMAKINKIWNEKSKHAESLKSMVWGPRYHGEMLISRYCFYAAQSYRDFKDHANALKYYKWFTTIKTDILGYNKYPENDHELFYSWFQIGSIILNYEEHYDIKDAIAAFIKAMGVIKQRIEPHFYLGRIFTNRGEHEKAYEFLKIGSHKPYPSKDLCFFIDDEIHTWKCKYEFAVACERVGKHTEGQEILAELMENPKYRLHPHMNIKKLYEALRFPNGEEIKEQMIQYNKPLVEKLCDRVLTNNGLVTLTVTTCKRFDLFVKTINSFLNCCQDIMLIDRYLCVDDNSSPEDRHQMQLLYPFFEFVFKTPEQKGHLESMLIIQQNVKTTYVLQMEDDWLFMNKMDYIQPAIAIMEQQKVVPIDPIHPSVKIDTKEIGQVVFNRNYQEEYFRMTAGGYLMNFNKKHLKQSYPFNTENLANNFRYVLHEYHPDKTPEYYEGMNKYKWNASMYWPYFSLNPSLMKTSVYAKIGPYEKTNGMFERAYAEKYNKAGYVTCFFDTICCTHIGKLLGDKNVNNKNAYELNGMNRDATQPKTVGGLINREMKLDGYDFYPNKDSYGGDLEYLGKQTLEKMKAYADSKPGCLGFNTWGYFKKAICPKEKLGGLENKFYETDGIFIKKGVYVNRNKFIDMNGCHKIHKGDGGVVGTLSAQNYKTVCVNLERRPERKERMRELFTTAHIDNYEFFKAVDGYALEPTEFIRQLFRNNNFLYRKGVIGCALSHYTVIQNLIEDDDHDFYLVFEDDVYLSHPDKFAQQLKCLLRGVRVNEADIIFLGSTQASTAPPQPTDYTQIEMRPVIEKDFEGGFFGYVLTKSGAQKFVAYIEENGIKHALDYLYKWIPDFNAFELTPHLVLSDCKQTAASAVQSDIQYNREQFVFSN